MPSNLEKKEIELNNSNSPETKLDAGSDGTVSNLSENISDAIDFETIESLTMGHISETTSSSKDTKDGTISSGSAITNSSSKTSASPLPPPRIMKREVELKIREEISFLSKKALKLSKVSHKNGNFYELSIVMRKLRKLKNLLSNMVNFSVDQVKNLWFRFVKEKK